MVDRPLDVAWTTSLQVAFCVFDSKISDIDMLELLHIECNPNHRPVIISIDNFVFP